MRFFDLHCDTAFECFRQDLPFDNGVLSVTPTPCLERWHQVFAIWIRDDLKKPWKQYKSILKSIKLKLINPPENLTALYAVEGGALLENRIERIEELRKDGIKMLTLTWNGENRLAGGVDSDQGLTSFGKEAIKTLNRNNIATDVSHLNRKSFFAAVEQSDFPIATHSNCYEICPHKRNLSKEQILALTQKGGILGLTFYPAFLGENIFERIYENICYMLDMNLRQHIAIGSDFDGGKMGTALDKTCKIPLLFNFLREKGMEKDLLDQIFFENAYNFIAKLK